METVRETLILRETNSEEVDTLVDFVGRYYAFDAIPFHPFDVRRSLLQLVSDPRLGKAWILRVNGISAGYAILTIGFDHEVGGRIGTITDFYLEPAFRGERHWNGDIGADRKGSRHAWAGSIRTSSRER